MKRHILIASVLLVAGLAHATTNEITVTANLKVSKNSTELTKRSGTQLIQMSGNRFFSTVISCTTTNTALSKGSVSGLGWCYTRNLSTAQAVEISFDAGATVAMKLLFSEAAVFRLAPSYTITNMMVKASSGEADFEFTVVEE